MRLHTFFRSSTSHRVRIALNVKGLRAEPVFHNLPRDEHKAPDYLSVNPQGFVPALEDAGLIVTQSLAIIEYLDEVHPEPRLLPDDPAGRARVRALSLLIACDIHPLQNLRVLRLLESRFGCDETAKKEWCRHWIEESFLALEARLSREPETGRYCHGRTVTMADACLVPQVVSARRFETDLTPYPTIRRINEACLELPAFVAAMPENQPDAP